MPRNATLLLLPLALLAAGAAGAQTSPEGEVTPLTFDQIFSPDRPGTWPKQIQWTSDSRQLTFVLPDEQGNHVLWGLDAATGTSAPLLAATELRAPQAAGSEPPEPGKATLGSYQWSRQGGLLVEADGAYYFVAKGGAGAQRLAAPSDGWEGPVFSPDGKQLAFSRGGNLYVRDLATGKERSLSRDGKPGTTLYGTTDWVYGEEIWDRAPEALWWSPDGRWLAFYRFDETPVASYPLLDASPTYPTVDWQKYPKAGTPNPKVKIGVVDPKKGKTVWLATGGADDDYLARVHWLPGSQALAVERLNRDQTRLELLRCDPTNGRCTTLLVEESKTWVNLSNDRHFFPDGSFLWSSEEQSWRHLYLYGADGKLIRPLTAGPFSITAVLAVDEAAGIVYAQAFSGSGMGGAHRRLIKVPLAGGEPKLLISPESGWNEGLFAPDGSAWLHTVSTADAPPRRRLYRSDGTSVADLPTGPPAAFATEGLPRWEFLSIWGLDGNKLPARLLKPANFDPSKKYPVIMYHYGGPGSQVVMSRWDGRGRDLWHKRMAQRGYVVFSVDNPTTIFFGKRGEDKVHRNFGAYNLEAQLAGVEYLKAQPWVDAGRIGLWGWSGGGTNTLLALLKKPGVWKAAVAGAPVTDWHLYDSIWTERYLDTPQDNPKGFEESSPLTYAGQLKDSLLLIHGTGDDNVHPQNSLVMSQAWINAGVAFEEAFYPGQKHGFRGSAERHFYERMTEYFDRQLKP